MSRRVARTITRGVGTATGCSRHGDVPRAFRKGRRQQGIGSGQASRFVEMGPDFVSAPATRASVNTPSAATVVLPEISVKDGLFHAAVANARQARAAMRT